MPKDTFLKHVQRSKAYIQAGDIIQVVGSQRFSAPIEHRRWMFIVPLDPSTSPYMFLLELNGFSSWELLQKSMSCEDRQVEIRPIAGTAHAERTKLRT